MKKFKCLSLILCVCIIVSSLSIFAHAIDIEIDLSDLFNPSTENNTGKDEGSSEGEDVKDEDTKDEDTKDEDTKDEDTKDEDTKDEDTKDEDTKDEDTKDEDTGKKPSSTRPSTSKSDRDDDDDDKKEEEKKPVVYKSEFKDVPKDKWFYSYVKNLASKGIVEGYEDESFRPQNNVTRAEFIKLLVVCMGYQASALPTFDDVQEKDWFNTYVSTAVKNGIISKEEYGSKLHPNEVITRAEAAKLLVRAAKLETGKYQTPYKDSDDEYVVALYTICLMQGEIDTTSGDRYFKPDTGITRAETSTVFSRLLEYNADPAGFVEEKMAEYGLSELKVLMTDANSFNNAIYGIGVSPMSFYLYRLDKETSHDDFSNSLFSSFEAAFSHLPEYFTFTDLLIEKKDADYGTEICASLVSTSNTFSLEALHDITLLSSVRADEITKELLYSDNETQTTEAQKLYAIYSYLAENTTYPDDNNLRDIDYLPMGVFANGSGTCQGISAAFNLLCRSVGINACAVSFNNHAFNCVLTKEGEYLFFDVTYEITASKASDDMRDKDEYSFFSLSHEKMQNIHGNFPLPLAFWCTLE